MEWYENLLGILAVIVCAINLLLGIPAIIAMRAGSISDTLLVCHKKKLNAHNHKKDN